MWKQIKNKCAPEILWTSNLSNKSIRSRAVQNTVQCVHTTHLPL
jgi:hypothetical protein